MKNTPINQFYSASEIRNAVKQVQQLSWTVTQFEKKFPFHQDLTDSELDDFIFAYLGFSEELKSIYRDLQRVLGNNPILSKALKTKRNEQSEQSSGLD